MKVWKPASEPQVNTPAWPPVEMMYFLPALTKVCTFDASSEELMPAQFSEPHSPVAKAQVSVVLCEGMARTTDSEVPVTEVWIAPVFQLASLVTSWYWLN